MLTAANVKRSLPTFVSFSSSSSFLLLLLFRFESYDVQPMLKKSSMPSHRVASFSFENRLNPTSKTIRPFCHVIDVFKVVKLSFRF